VGMTDRSSIADTPSIVDTRSVADTPLGQLVIPLLKGVIYRQADERRWQDLVSTHIAVRDYVSILGLELYLDDAEGYAFLRTPPADDVEESSSELPRLVTRRRLTYGVSLLLALLRKRLAEFDATSGDDTTLVMTRGAIVELVAVFQPSTTNEAKQQERVERDIDKIVELGFLRPLQQRARRNEEPSYEVRRILQAFIDAQWMADFNERLEEYRRGDSHVRDSHDEPDTNGERDATGERDA
jgi:Domain of unknown function (DUF4194)